MSQRESPTTDRTSGVASVLPLPVRSPLRSPAAPLSGRLRSLLGLPALVRTDRLAPASQPWDQLLHRLHSPSPVALPSYELPDSATVDFEHLSARQSEAIQRALHTPDLFLIQGTAGSGKSHVASQILRQAAEKGLRVLFLATTPAAIERALLPLLEGAKPIAVHCVGEFGSCLSGATLTEHVRTFHEQTLGAGQTAIEQHQADGRRHAAHEALLDELATLHQQQARHAEVIAQTESRLAQLPADAESVDSAAAPEELRPLCEALAQTRAEVARQRDELARQRTECLQREQDQRAELDRLQPLLAAHQSGRWWTPTYWRARSQGDVQSQAATLEQSCRDLQAEALRAQQTVDQLNARLAEQTEAARSALAQLRQTLETTLHQHHQDRTAGTERWDAIVQQLPESLRPGAVSDPALEQSRRRWSEQRDALSRALSEAEQRQQELERESEGLTERLGEAIPIIAGTLASIRNSGAGGLERTAGGFDLLVLEEADRVTEADLHSVGEMARRWVLIGEPGLVGERDPGTARRNGRGGLAHLQPGVYHRLWNRLHDDPSARAVAWRQELERLVCVLATVPPEQERWIQPEPVVDHPEIVLHIWSPPRQTPRLVEVEFPAGTSIEDAKAFVLRELEELPLQTRAHGLAWEETPESVVVHLGGDLPGRSHRVPLLEGVTEVVHLLAGHWHTSRLEYARSTWTRAGANAWLQTRLGLGNHDRTLLLDRPHRATAALAGWLADLFDEGYRPTTVPTPCVEFVTVPSLSDDRPGRRPDPAGSAGGVATLAPKLKALRGGAGVEINLAEPRRHDLLPRELREVLPDEGLVNYLEAQACVRIVRELLDDPATQEQILAWQQKNNPACRRPAACPPRRLGERLPGIALLALYPAQVRLIRYLLETVPLGTVCVEVALPEEMRHRECAVAVVSLTRSHLHRAVPYGEHPAQLRLALTRAAQRLILLGDPGTLLRRSQYGEVVDPLDAAESQQEQQLAARLVRYLQGHGMQQRAFTIRELAGL